jgi:hypothetical protein
MRGLRTLFWRWWYRLRPAPSKYTRAEALAIAKKYNLEYEVIMAMEHTARLMKPSRIGISISQKRAEGLLARKFNNTYSIFYNICRQDDHTTALLHSGEVNRQ